MLFIIYMSKTRGSKQSNNFQHNRLYIFLVQHFYVRKLLCKNKCFPTIFNDFFEYLDITTKIKTHLHVYTRLVRKFDAVAAFPEFIYRIRILCQLSLKLNSRTGLVAVSRRPSCFQNKTIKIKTALTDGAEIRGRRNR